MVTASVRFNNNQIYIVYFIFHW